MKTILVTGGDGQLAQCIKDLDDNSSDNFIYTNSAELDITNSQHVNTFFEANAIDWCINCAAYTAVDKAEAERTAAESINATGVKNLAIACNNTQVKLIHISTDFVFDGTASNPYSETSKTNPLGVYGHTKLKGEKLLISHLEEHFIIRTSWLYSEHGNNFLKTMLRLAKDRNKLNVVCDQIGSPTYAKDLASVILKIIASDSIEYGLYHYSNSGVASWYDFAKAIFEMNTILISVDPIPTSMYPTPAKRPHFSVMDQSKIKKTFNFAVPYWRDSLKIAISRLS